MEEKPADGMRRLAITIEIDTANRALWPDQINVENEADAAAIDAVVKAELPHMRRVVAIMNEADYREVFQHIFGICARGAEDEIPPPARRH